MVIEFELTARTLSHSDIIYNGAYIEMKVTRCKETLNKCMSFFFDSRHHLIFHFHLSRYILLATRMGLELLRAIRNSTCSLWE